jgi:hypothetical protein
VSRDKGVLAIPLDDAERELLDAAAARRGLPVEVYAKAVVLAITRAIDDKVAAGIEPASALAGLFSGDTKPLIGDADILGDGNPYE